VEESSAVEDQYDIISVGGFRLISVVRSWMPATMTKICFTAPFELLPSVYMLSFLCYVGVTGMWGLLSVFVWLPGTLRWSQKVRFSIGSDSTNPSKNSVDDPENHSLTSWKTTSTLLLEPTNYAICFICLNKSYWCNNMGCWLWELSQKNWSTLTHCGISCENSKILDLCRIKFATEISS